MGSAIPAVFGSQTKLDVNLKEGEMAKQINPSDYGIDMSKDDFMDLMVNDFSAHFRGGRTFDDLLLHPKDAFNFCESVRAMHGFEDLPDNVILRSVMIRRKNPR